MRVGTAVCTAGLGVRRRGRYLAIAGIEETTGTGTTSLSTTPDADETVAVLLRAGARRNRRRVSAPSEQNLPAKKHQSGNQRAQTAQPSLVEDETEAEMLSDWSKYLATSNRKILLKYPRPNLSTATAKSPAPSVTKAVPHTFADVLNRGAQPDDQVPSTQIDSTQHDLSPTAAPGRHRAQASAQRPGVRGVGKKIGVDFRLASQRSNPAPKDNSKACARAHLRQIPTKYLQLR